MNQKPWIVVVDDDADVLYVKRMLLQREGCAVLTACDAVSAMRILSVVRVDLVIIDYYLQDSGTDLAAAVKDLYPAMPIVLQAGEVEGVEDEHVDAVLSKADHPTVLFKTIKRLLNKRTRFAQAG